jgi:hypothetical protein
MCDKLQTMNLYLMHDKNYSGRKYFSVVRTTYLVIRTTYFVVRTTYFVVRTT